MKKHLFFFFLLGTAQAHAQKSNIEDLCRIWYLDKYSDDEAYYHPPKKEEGEFISFKEDMTYEAKSAGEMTSGTWMLNTNGNYIELKDAELKTEKIYIHFVSRRSLVVTYDTDAYRTWEVHYISGT
ncbi:MAG: hypothetical protein KI790_14800 [Cyclobacteriaceae bacterium]|nr:hypothetical protein [Cyclobacteriaceae bacterium HetDA_MAG_MS6]